MLDDTAKQLGDSVPKWVASHLQDCRSESIFCGGCGDCMFAPSHMGVVQGLFWPPVARIVACDGGASSPGCPHPTHVPVNLKKVA